ncbi:MAG TPA: hypothetical protein VEZ88_01905 [Steroidobacteraceae bacterium]|nr:hypothetical protein [Steroidobacteraceae bacterium]
MSTAPEVVPTEHWIPLDRLRHASSFSLKAAPDTRTDRRCTRTTKRLYQLLALLTLVCLTPIAHGASFIYEIRGDTGGANNIWRIDPVAVSVSVAYTGYPGGNAATLAQCPNGFIYYTINVANGGVYRWNPATPATAPVLLGTLGGAIPGSFRFACSTTGTLYYMPDSGVLYTINTITGAATAGPVVTGMGSGGDMAFNSAGVLYAINSSRQLFTAPIGGGAATLLGTVTFPGGITPATLGLAFDSAGNLYTQTQNPTNLYRISGTTATLVTGLLGGTTATGDLASAFLASPNITVGKAFAPSTIVTSVTSTLTVTLTNANTVALTAAAFSDTYPAGVVNAATPAPATTCGGTVTASAGGSTLTLSGGTIPASGSCTVSVSVTSASAGTYTNTLAARAVTTSTVYNDSAASAVLTVKSPPSVTKSSAVFSDPVNGAANPKRIPGSFVDYTITTSNSANGALDNNQVVVSDAVPANTELFVGDLGGAGSGPIAFIDGAPASGLSYTFTSLASVTDDVSFSNNGGISFTYVPTANANGVDTAVTHIRINPKGTFSSSSSFQLRLRVRVR